MSDRPRNVGRKITTLNSERRSAILSRAMGTRRVPWADWAEWEEVRAGLQGTDTKLRDAALRRITTWRFRGNTIPHAVDVTAQLLEARMHDEGVQGSPGPHLSTVMLQLTYSMVRAASRRRPRPHT
jgi:hypothetical protein